MDGSIEKGNFENFPIFNFKIPTEIAQVPSTILNPRNTWENKDQYDETAKKLATQFVENFKKFTATDAGKAVEKVGPTI